MSAPLDKTYWQQIIGNDFALPEDADLRTLTDELLSNLGNLDPKIRDDIVYNVLSHWIVRDKRYTPAQLRTMRDQLVKNLDNGIGQNNDDSVLLRSFSALILSLIVYHDDEVDFLTVDEVMNLLNVAIQYLNHETDLRGYDDALGWLHTTAHTADLIKFLVRNNKTTAENHILALQGTATALLRPTRYVYGYNEDERIALVIYEILKRDLVSFGDWYQWSQRFSDWKQENSHSEAFKPDIFRAHQNVKSLMRSLYFRLERVDDLSITAQKVRNEAHELSKLFSM